MERAAFERAVAEGRFLEWVEYGGYLYGTLRSDVEGRLARGDDVILEIELQGARALRRALPQATSVFLAPPSAAELAERLRGRGTESAQAVETRLRIAEQELAAAREFDYVVINDVAGRAAAEVADIIRAQRAAQTEGE
jgi:guanylate kinase